MPMTVMHLLTSFEVGGAEVVALDGERFRSLVSESKPTWDALNHVAEERIVENTNGRNGANHA